MTEAIRELLETTLILLRSMRVHISPYQPSMMKSIDFQIREIEAAVADPTPTPSSEPV